MHRFFLSVQSELIIPWPSQNHLHERTSRQRSTDSTPKASRQRVVCPGRHRSFEADARAHTYGADLWVFSARFDDTTTAETRVGCTCLPQSAFSVTSCAMLQGGYMAERQTKEQAEQLGLRCLSAPHRLASA